MTRAGALLGVECGFSGVTAFPVWIAATGTQWSGGPVIVRTAGLPLLALSGSPEGAYKPLLATAHI